MAESSKVNVIRADISCKEWIGEGPDSVPSVDRVRPNRCPSCKAPAKPIEGNLNLHGHGKRWRSVLGIKDCPASLQATGEDGIDVLDTRIRVRRYLCVVCEVTCTVVPSEVRPYGTILRPLIAFAFCLWAHHPESPSTGTIRRWLFPDHRFGPFGWPALRRWANSGALASEAGAGLSDDMCPKARAEMLVQVWRTRAPPKMRPRPVLAQVICGARHAP